MTLLPLAIIQKRIFSPYLYTDDFPHPQCYLPQSLLRCHLVLSKNNNQLIFPSQPLRQSWAQKKNVHHPKVFQKWKLLASTLAKSCFAGKETFLSGISYIISREYDPLFRAAFEEYFGNVCPEGGPKENDQRVSKTKEFAFLCLFLCIKV